MIAIKYHFRLTIAVYGFNAKLTRLELITHSLTLCTDTGHVHYIAINALTVADR